MNQRLTFPFWVIIFCHMYSHSEWESSNITQNDSTLDTVKTANHPS